MTPRCSESSRVPVVLTNPSKGRFLEMRGPSYPFVFRPEMFVAALGREFFRERGFLVGLSRRRCLATHNGCNIDRHLHRVLAAAEDDAFDGADVVVVAAPGQHDVAVVGDLVVGRVKVDPAKAGAEERDPGMRGLGADGA